MFLTECHHIFDRRSVLPYRVASITSGQTAVTQCTHTGTQPMTMKTLWMESVCTWMWTEAGGEQTAKLRSQEPCAMFPQRVSATSVKPEKAVSVARNAWKYTTFSAFLLLFLTGIKPFISYELVCPSTWVKFGQGCYNFEPVVEKLTFEESREHCRQKGGCYFSYLLPAVESLSV